MFLESIMFRDLAASYVLFRLDGDRLKQVGGEHACAEWVLRCGGSIRWSGSHRSVSDFNELPSAHFADVKSTDSRTVEEIKAEGATLTDSGFQHLSKNSIENSILTERYHVYLFQVMFTFQNIALVSRSWC